MDVIISAPQGGGKTTAAMILATGYLSATSWNAAKPDVLEVTEHMMANHSPGMLADLIERYAAKVVIFDEVIVGPETLCKAIKAVKRYREVYEKETRGRGLLAIYCEQHGTKAVVLQFPDNG